MKTATRKIVGLDLTRSFAIILAMFAHALTAVGASDYVMEAALPAFLVMRSSTPTFIILLDVMLEIVYKRRLLEVGAQRVYERLVERALLCWLLYALSNLPLLITGRMGLSYYVATATLLGSSPFTDILRYYAIIFFFAPFLLAFRVRFGSVAIMAVTAILIFAHPLIVQIPAPEETLVEGIALRLSDLVFGIGDGVTGPSVIHSLFFIGTGMTLGSLLQSAKASRRQVRAGWLAFLLAFLAIGALVSFYVGPEHVSLKGMASKELRNSNHPFYFFNRAFWTCSLILILSSVRREGTGPLRFTMLGQRSLFTFAFGNAFLYFLLGFVDEPNFHGVLFAVGLLLAVIIFSAMYDVAISADVKEPSNRLIARCGRMTRGVLDPPNAAIRRIAATMTRFFLKES